MVCKENSIFDEMMLKKSTLNNLRKKELPWPWERMNRNLATHMIWIWRCEESKKILYTIHNFLEQPWRHFTSLKLYKCSQIPLTSTRVTSISSNKKNSHWLNHLQTHYAQERHLDCEKTKGGLLNFQENTRRLCNHSWLTPETKR